MKTGIALTSLAEEFSLSAETLQHLIDTIFQFPVQKRPAKGELLVREKEAETLRTIFQQDIQEAQDEITESILGDLAMYIEAINLSAGDQELRSWYAKCAEACITHDGEAMMTTRLRVAIELLRIDVSALQEDIGKVNKETKRLAKKKRQLLPTAQKQEAALREEAERREAEAAKHQGIYEKMPDDTIAQRFYQKVYLPYVEQTERITTEAAERLKRAQRETDELEIQLNTLSERQTQLEEALEEEEKALHQYQEFFDQMQDVLEQARQLGIPIHVIGEQQR